MRALFISKGARISFTASRTLKHRSIDFIGFRVCEFLSAHVRLGVHWPRPSSWVYWGHVIGFAPIRGNPTQSLHLHPPPCGHRLNHHIVEGAQTLGNPHTPRLRLIHTSPLHTYQQPPIPTKYSTAS